MSEQELEGLENICEQFLLFAESKAFRGQKMTMEEITTKLNTLLAANDYQVLYEYKTYLKGRADAHAQEQFNSYKARIGTTDAKSIPASTTTTADDKPPRKAAKSSARA